MGCYTKNSLLWMTQTILVAAHAYTHIAARMTFGNGYWADPGEERGTTLIIIHPSSGSPSFFQILPQTKEFNVFPVVSGDNGHTEQETARTLGPWSTFVSTMLVPNTKTI